MQIINLENMKQYILKYKSDLQIGRTNYISSKIKIVESLIYSTKVIKLTINYNILEQKLLEAYRL